MKKIIFSFSFLAILLFSCEEKIAQQKTAFQLIMEQDEFYANRDSVKFTNMTEMKIINSDSLYVIRSFFKDDEITRGYLKKDKFILVITDTVERSFDAHDALIDVDFDGFQDYVIRYPYLTTGDPSLKFKVFRYNPQSKAFDKKIKLENAYFDAVNKVVMRMDYDFFKSEGDGRTALTKSKWSADSLVATEYIYWGGDSTLRLAFVDGDQEMLPRDLPDNYKKIPMVNVFYRKAKSIDKNNP